MWGIKKRKIREERKKYLGIVEPTEPDVILDIPEVNVDEIIIEVNRLEANLFVNAAVSNFINVEAGADVRINRVKVLIEGVRAEAYLKVRLERVKAILNRTIQTLDNNPEVLKALLQPLARGLGSATGSIGKGARGTTTHVGKGAKESLAGTGKGVRKLLSKAGDAITGFRLKKGIGRMLSNLNIL